MRVTGLYGYLAVFVAVARANSLTAIYPWSPLGEISGGIFAKFESGQERSSSKLSKANLDWEGPEHCVNETCIISNDHMGDGIVLITSEINAKIASNFPVTGNNGAAALPFHVAEVPGKGVGIVADRKIRKGETILIRSPTMMVQTAPHVGMESGTRDVLYDLAVGKLPTRGRELFMSQMGKDIYNKIETNCFSNVHRRGKRLWWPPRVLSGDISI